MMATYLVSAFRRAADGSLLAFDAAVSPFGSLSAAIRWIDLMRKIPGQAEVQWHIVRVASGFRDLISDNAGLVVDLTRRDDCNVSRLCDLADQLEDELGVCVGIRMIEPGTAELELRAERDAVILLREMRKLRDAQPTTEPIACAGVVLATHRTEPDAHA